MLIPVTSGSPFDSADVLIPPLQSSQWLLFSVEIHWDPSASGGFFRVIEALADGEWDITFSLNANWGFFYRATQVCWRNIGIDALFCPHLPPCCQGSSAFWRPDDHKSLHFYLSYGEQKSTKMQFSPLTGIMMICQIQMERKQSVIPSDPLLLMSSDFTIMSTSLSLPNNCRQFCVF